MQELTRHTLATQRLCMEHCLVPWDTEVFGQPVAQIDRFSLRAGPEAAQGAAARDFQAYEEWRVAQRVALEMAKLDADDLPEVAFLEARGFRWMETQYRLSWELGLERPEADAGLHVAPLQDGDLASVETLAAHAFETSRYAMDPAIGPEWAGRRYRAWVRNALQGGVQQVLVARDGRGEQVGFFVVQQTDTLGYWHLTAIDPARQGQGWGVRLWRHMMAWHIERGVRRIETAVSGHNLRVLGLYGRLGFRFSQGVITLHRGGLLWAQDGSDGV